MIIPDFKLNERVALQQPAWLPAVYWAIHILAVVCVVFTHLSWVLKLLLLSLVFVSALHVRAYLAHARQVEQIFWQDRALSMVYCGQVLPAAIAGSPVVTPWLVVVSLRLRAEQSLSQRLKAEFKSWLTFSTRDWPGTVTLFVVPGHSCSAEQHCALRRFLLNYSYRPSES